MNCGKYITGLWLDYVSDMSTIMIHIFVEILIRSIFGSHCYKNHGQIAIIKNCLLFLE